MINDAEHEFVRRASEQRTLDDKIARLRARLKNTPLDANAMRGILLGILDLLGDEL